MKMNSSLTTMIGLASFFLSIALYLPASAQTMFRCGSAYQDRPCDEGKQSKTMTSARSTQSPVSSGGINAFCSQRGGNAQKIVWAREGGAMLDQQLAKSRNGDEMTLISNVYQKRGTSAEVRAAIESECTVEQEKAARMAALIGTDKPSSPSLNAIDSGRTEIGTNPKIVGGPRVSDSAVQDAANKKAECDYLNETLANTRDAQRSGGNMTTMDMLHKQKAATEKKLAQTRC